MIQALVHGRRRSAEFAYSEKRKANSAKPLILTVFSDEFQQIAGQVGLRQKPGARL